MRTPIILDVIRDRNTLYRESPDNMIENIYTLKIINQDERVLKDPAPMVAVSELADSSVNFTARAWTAAGDYWSFYFDTTEKVKKQFDAEGISIPFPQRDVHLHQQNAA